MKPKVGLQWILLCICVSFGCGGAQAEVVALEGVVTGVDLNARQVTIERQTPTGKKALSLELVGEAGQISRLKPGLPVHFNYDPKLEVMVAFRIPMTAGDLLGRLSYLRQKFGKPAASGTKDDSSDRMVAVDQGYAWGYINAVVDAHGTDKSGNKFYFVPGRGGRELEEYLESHPEKANLPAYKVVADFLQSE